MIKLPCLLFNSLLDEIGCYYRAYDEHNNNIICYKYGISGHFLIPKDGILKGFQLVHYNGSFSCRSGSIAGKRIWGCSEKGSKLLLSLYTISLYFFQDVFLLSVELLFGSKGVILSFSRVGNLIVIP